MRVHRHLLVGHPQGTGVYLVEMCMAPCRGLRKDIDTHHSQLLSTCKVSRTELNNMVEKSGAIHKNRPDADGIEQR